MQSHLSEPDHCCAQACYILYLTEETLLLKQLDENLYRNTISIPNPKAICVSYTWPLRAPHTDSMQGLVSKDNGEWRQHPGVYLPELMSSKPTSRPFQSPDCHRRSS
jgi:hypothetical protein